MKGLFFVAICLSLSSCSDSGNINRSYVISKAHVEPVEDAVEE